MLEMTATSYCLKGKTASGTPVRVGICASKPEYIGKVAAIYKKDKHGCIGDFLGYYLIEDTGGKNIKSGKVIDIWLPSYSEARKFGNPKVYVKIIEAEW